MAKFTIELLANIFPHDEQNLSKKIYVGFGYDDQKLWMYIYLDYFGFSFAAKSHDRKNKNAFQ